MVTTGKASAAVRDALGATQEAPAEEKVKVDPIVEAVNDKSVGEDELVIGNEYTDENGVWGYSPSFGSKKSLPIIVTYGRQNEKGRKGVGFRHTALDMHKRFNAEGFQTGTFKFKDIPTALRHIKDVITGYTEVRINEQGRLILIKEVSEGKGKVLVVTAGMIRGKWSVITAFSGSLDHTRNTSRIVAHYKKGKSVEPVESRPNNGVRSSLGRNRPARSNVPRSRRVVIQIEAVGLTSGGPSYFHGRESRDSRRAPLPRRVYQDHAARVRACCIPRKERPVGNPSYHRATTVSRTRLWPQEKYKKITQSGHADVSESKSTFM